MTEPKLYVVDIRVFLVAITLAMAASFIAGVGLTPLNLTAVVPLEASSPYHVNSHTTVPDDPPKQQPTGAEDHLPAGQHLLVDIKGVESDFLNSEARLSQAMVDTVEESGLTMLSYHCHALLPAGVSCVGVLLESHISFHTWPDEGVLTLDLFTCGPKPLLPAVATIERLFGIPHDPSIPITSRWSHELRGFRNEEERKSNYLADSSDLSLWVLSPLEVHSKTQVYSGLTAFQRVDIWDMVEVTDTPSWDDVLKYKMNTTDPRLAGPEWASPDRMLFLDGTLQAVTGSERVYHEAMVHPALFAHPSPERVAILGGGEGATLREVLKHKTVKSAVMIEIDEELVQLAKEYLPKMSDCSDLQNSVPYCLDDDRVTVHYTDGRQWFIDRYGPHKQQAEQEQEEGFDVIVVDALDPEDETEISDLLYSDESFLSSLLAALTPQGVLVIQVGTAATIDDPRPDFGIYKNREVLFQMLEASPQVEAMFVYEEAHCGFLEPHAFLLVCKSVDCRKRWYARADQVDFAIYDRIAVTHSGDRALVFFDGMTQRSYQWPKKGWETVYCRREPTPPECGFRHLPVDATLRELDLDDENESDFSIVTLTDEETDKVTSTKVMAKVDIKKGDFIMPNDLASSLMITDRNLEGLQNNLEVGGGRVTILEDLLQFFDDYGHESQMPGSAQQYIEVGGSALMRRSAEHANVGRWFSNAVFESGKRPKYSPVLERHRVSLDVFLVATQDVSAGQELVVDAHAWD